MTTETIKKYTLSEEEISAIETTLEVVRALGWEGFHSYGGFYGSSLSFTDMQENLQIILENNDKNLE